MIQIENTYFELGKSSVKNCLIICDRGAMDASACKCSLIEWKKERKTKISYSNPPQTYAKINGNDWWQLIIGMPLNCETIVIIKLFIWYRRRMVQKISIPLRYVLQGKIIYIFTKDKEKINKNKIEFILPGTCMPFRRCCASSRIGLQISSCMGWASIFRCYWQFNRFRNKNESYDRMCVSKAWHWYGRSIIANVT